MCLNLRGGTGLGGRMEEAQWHLFCTPLEARQDKSGSQQFPAWRQERCSSGKSFPKRSVLQEEMQRLVSVESLCVMVVMCLPVCHFLALSCNDSEESRTFVTEGPRRCGFLLRFSLCPWKNGF